MPLVTENPYLAFALLVFAAALTCVHFLMEPWRWIACYLPLRIKKTARGKLRDTLFATALASYLLPFKLGIPLRVGLLRRQTGLALHFIGVIIAIDGVLSILVWAALAGASAWLIALSWSPPWYLLVGGVMITTLGAFLLRARIGRRALGLFESVISELTHPVRRLLKAGTILVLDVLSYALRHACLLVLLTGKPSDALVGAGAGLVATFAGIVSGLPMGLVGYDATLIALLSVSGVNAGQALAVVLLNRFLNLGCAAILGVPAAIRLGLGSGLVSIMRKLREMSRGKS